MRFAIRLAGHSPAEVARLDLKPVNVTAAGLIPNNPLAREIRFSVGQRARARSNRARERAAYL